MRNPRLGRTSMNQSMMRRRERGNLVSVLRGFVGIVYRQVGTWAKAVSKLATLSILVTSTSR